MSFSKIKISGGFFISPKEFQFFDKQSQVAAVIYGKNGSGKSSISRAFQEAFNSPNGEQYSPEFSSIEFFKLMPNSQQTSVSKEQIQTPFYIHNDNFTFNKVSFNEDGLDTIVMFGKQIDIQSEIDKLNIQLQKDEKLLEDKKDTLRGLSDKKDPQSHLYFKESIKENLRNNWAVRYQKITNTKTSGKVSRKLFEEIINFTANNDDYYKLKDDFEVKLEKINLIKEAKPNYKTISKFSIPNNIEKLIMLLSLKLEEPILSENEQKILNVFSTLDNKKASDAISFLKSPENTCHLCFQPVEKQYKLSVLETIKKILDTEEANKLKRQLKKISIDEYHINVEPYKAFIEKEVITELETAVSKYNSFIKHLENERQNKLENPYSPIEIEREYLIVLVENINKSISSINSIIIKFNEEIKLKEKIENELLEINKKMAYLECKDLIKVFLDKKNKYLLLEKEIKDLSININNIKNELEKKKSTLANVNIALDLINDYLKYIFYDEKRLYLVPSENKYKIMSRDKPVKPKDLSVGEKNIISLCYFFSTLFQNQSVEDLFKNECILILDDPLSSFDFENKVGVYSFLRYILNELHSGNPKSKSIIFTHDLDVFYNISKVYSDINIKGKAINYLFLENQEFSSIKLETFDEYSKLLRKIYNFATYQTDDSTNIGNNMRRVLEAFATFNYKCGIEQLTTNEEILSKLPTKEYRDYFKNSMYRLILHTESHLKERSRLLLSTFKEHFSIEEKRRTAKDILILLYLLDDVHLKFHLQDNNDDDYVAFKIEKIKSWKEEIFKKEEAELSSPQLL